MMRSLAMTNIRLAVAMVVMASSAAVQAAPKCPGADLIRDDFSRFPPGWLSKPVGTLNGAIQEYHYLPHRGVPLDPWEAPIVHLDAWIAGDEEGVPYVEQHIINEL